MRSTIVTLSLLKKGKDGLRGRADRDVGHQSEVFYQADRLPLWRLRRADETPMCVVQLARFGKLALAADWRVHAPQMREGRRERQTVEHLGDDAEVESDQVKPDAQVKSSQIELESEV